MTRLKRSATSALSDDKSLRLRAAWLYHAQGLTQNEVAEKLSLGRSTVIRLLDEAKERGEVKVWIEEGEAGLIDLGTRLEQAFGLDEAIVIPSSESVEGAARSTGLALGKFLSEVIASGMTIGVGWGRTLNASLASFHPPRHENIRIMSLVGGAIETEQSNPVEFSWRMASVLGAECFLFPAPVIVDSAETKRRLIELSGLDRLFKLAASLDLAVLGVGDIGSNSTSVASRMVRRQELQELMALGAVGDVMCNFLDAEGRAVAHPVNDRIMSIDLATIRTAGHIVLAGGGAARATAIAAAIKATRCNTLVTDEAAARDMLNG